MRQWIISIALLAAACADAEGKKAPQQASQKVAPKTRAVRVEVATIAESRPSLQLVLPGEVEGSRESTLASPAGGYVERVLIDVGDRVKQGQSLAWVNKSILDVQLQHAKVQLDLATIEHQMAQRAGSSVPLARRGAADYGRQAAEAQYKLAEINAERAVVRAPFAGVIAERYVEQGEVLPPGGRVVRVVALDPLHVSLSVSDRDVVSLKPGMPAKVTAGAGSSQLFDAKIVRVSPAADLETRTFEVLVEVPEQEGRLRPGMIATVRVGVSMEDDRLAIPQHVLVTRLEGNGVFVEEEGTAKWRPLELGPVVRGQVVVESGISAGDRVVVTGHRELQDGDPLLIARNGTCCTNGQIVFGAE
jgi:membrane fusion protein (multidrug efflux system)